MLCAVARALCGCHIQQLLLNVNYAKNEGETQPLKTRHEIRPPPLTTGEAKVLLKAVAASTETTLNALAQFQSRYSATTVDCDLCSLLQVLVCAVMAKRKLVAVAESDEYYEDEESESEQAPVAPVRADRKTKEQKPAASERRAEQPHVARGRSEKGASQRAAAESAASKGSPSWKEVARLLKEAVLPEDKHKKAAMAKAVPQRLYAATLGLVHRQRQPSTLSAATRWLPNLTRALFAAFGKAVPGAAVTSIRVQHGGEAPLHSDDGNLGQSWVIAFGNHWSKWHPSCAIWPDFKNMCFCHVRVICGRMYIKRFWAQMLDTDGR